MNTFDVRFQPRFSVTDPKANSFRLAGRGSITVTPQSVIVIGRRHRPFWFSQATELQWSPGEIVNVTRSGREVTLHVRGRAEHLRLWLETTEQADALARQLPAERTPEFATAYEQHSAFQQQLDALGAQAWVAPVLVALNVAIFLALASQGAGIAKPDVAVMTRWGTNFGPLTMGGEWWRLGSAMFLHFGLLHLFMNMWALWSGGRLIERLYGSRQFLAIYLFAGLTGSLASLIWNPLVNSAGASGAIFGLYGSLLAFFAHEHQGVPAAIVQSQRNSALTFIAYSLIFGLTHEGIDNAAHIGGLVGGFTMGWLLARPIDGRADAPTHWPRAAALALAALGILSAPLLRPANDVRNDQGFMLEIDELQKLESSANAAFNLRVDQAKAGVLSEVDFGKKLTDEVIPLWDDLEARIARISLGPESPFLEQHRFMTRYCRLRGEGLRLLRDGVLAGDPKLIEQAGSRFQEQQRALEEHRRGQAARR